MKYAQITPPPPFDQVVDCVWFLTGPSAEHDPQPVVPDGRFELLLHRAQPFTRIETDGSLNPQQSLLVAGQLTGPLHLKPGDGGPIDVVGIRLHPLGASAILGIPLDELTDQVLPLGDVNRRLAAALAPMLDPSGTPTVTAEAVLVALGRTVAEAPCSKMTVALQALAGGAPMNELSGMVGISDRTLGRRFRMQVGLSPKLYQRVVRFRRAFRMLSRSAPGQWTRVALAAGYYDQAHLIRDFRGFAGAAPGDFFRADPSLARAFSTADLTGHPLHGEIDSPHTVRARPFDAGDQ